MTKYTFGEKDVEKIKGIEYKVWQSPKYKESKDKAIEMIESKKYGLSEGDFWILKNKINDDTYGYSGLIISHNGCLKINDNLDNKVNPKCFEIDKDGFNGSLVYTYVDDDCYEVGEFSSANGSRNEYPYAMAFKRCFDRVVLKKSKLAYSGIYSEVEADEIRKTNEDTIIDETKKHLELETKLYKLCDENKINYEKINNLYKVEDIHLMSIKQLENAILNIDKIKGE